ncbi:hypothetical protein MKEN_01367400 [Mycena kentingensis (nom. inval.)]|nr:hypothetical protein MKEN_01367400 [Mycena kentingensis (nom. inval.)]
MPPRRSKCRVCATNESKYTCSVPGCSLDYCSVACYKQHKGQKVAKPPTEGSYSADSSCIASGRSAASERDQPLDAPPLPAATEPGDQDEPPLSESPTLRPLTSLKWPYVPDQSSYPDPLKRDDPKPLQTHQYEAIATSSAIRDVLAAHPSLHGLLTEIDKLRGHERENALQRALGLGAADIAGKNANRPVGDDVLALRALAEAVEAAVRGGKDGALGLDWE